MGKTTETLEFLINANVSGVTKAFQDVGDAADKNLTKAQTRSDQVSANLTKFGAGAVAVAGIVGAGLVKLGSDFDSAFDKIRVGTGATGDKLKGLQGDFKAALSQVPNSMDEVSTAITTLNQKLGLSGKPLQELSVQFLNLSTITGTDLTKNIDAATGAFNNFGIDAANQGKELDTLFKVTQASGVSFETLTTSLSASGAQFRAVGIDFDHAAGLIGLLAKNGLSASDVIPALGKAMATAAKDGIPAQQVFQQTFDAIKNAPTDTAAAGDAIQVFGAKAGPKLAVLIREGKVSLDDLIGSVNASGDTINAAAADTFDFGEKLGILKNKLEVAIEPAVSSAFDNLTTVVGLLGDAFDALPEPVVGAAGNIILFGTAALGAVGAVSLVAGQVTKLVDVAKGAGGAIGSFAKFLGSVGPEAVIAGGAIAGVGAVLALNASAHALAASRIKEYVAALKEEADGSTNAVKGLIAQKITSNDVADTAKRLGLSVQDVANIITGQSVPAYDALKERIQKINDTGQQTSQANAKLITDYANLKGTILDQSAAYAGAIKQSADLAAANKALGIDTGETAAQTVAAAKATADKAVTDAAAVETTKELTKAANDHAAAIQAELQALLDVAKAEQDQIDAQRAAADASVAVGKAEDEQTTFLAGLSKEINDAKGNQQKLNDINREAVGHSTDLADATSKLADQQAAAAGTTAGATAKFDTWNQSMLVSASQLSGPVQDAVLSYIGATDQIPPEKLTEIKADVEQGKIDEALAALRAIAPTYKTAVNADTANAQANLQKVIDKLNQITSKTIFVDAVGGVHVGGAASGGFHQGLTLVGEKGPELVTLPNGAYVYTADQTAKIKAMAGGGIVGPVTASAGATSGGGTLGSLLGISGPQSGTLHALFGPGGAYAMGGNDPLRKLFGPGADFALWKLNSGKWAGWDMIHMFGPGSDFYRTGADALEVLFGTGADFANYTTRSPNFKGTISTTPPGSMAPTGGIGGILTPGFYSDYGGVKTGTVPFTPAPAGGSQYDTPYYTAYGGPVNAPPAGGGGGGARFPSGGSGNGDILINQVIINMPAGSDGEDVVQALKRYERRNGSIPIHTS